MENFFAVVISGIVSGSAYALLALAIVIIFRSTDTVNFAIGEIGMLAVFASSTLIATGLPVFLGLLAAMLIAGCLGVLSERLLVRPLGHGRHMLFLALVITIGLGLLIHATILTFWDNRPRPFPALVDGTVKVAGISLAWNQVMAMLTAVIAMVAVAWFFKRTSFGVTMLATADDPVAARIVGVDAGLVSSGSWFLACTISALAVFFLAADTSLNPNLTASAFFRAIAGVFLGGLTSMPGAVIGGFVIGILDNIAGRYLSASYRDTIVFATIVLVLFIRPAGILGAGRKERV